MKITKRQLRRIIKEELNKLQESTEMDYRIERIETHLMRGDLDLAASALRSLGEEIQYLRGSSMDPKKLEDLEDEHDRLDRKVYQLLRKQGYQGY